MGMVFDFIRTACVIIVIAYILARANFFSEERSRKRVAGSGRSPRGRDIAGLEFVWKYRKHIDRGILRFAQDDSVFCHSELCEGSPGFFAAYFISAQTASAISVSLSTVPITSSVVVLPLMRLRRSTRIFLTTVVTT